MTNWYTVDTTEEQERLEAAWADAPIDNAETCGLILAVARYQVIAYASSTRLASAVDQILTRRGYSTTALAAVLVAIEEHIAAAETAAVTADLEAAFADLDDPDSALADALAAIDGEEPTYPPDNLVYAQLKQTENLWNAGRVSSDGNFDGTGYTFTPRPLDKTIRGIIRPIDGNPDVL